jgi:predicted Rossmann-fold nucleotide-binding protein
MVLDPIGDPSKPCGFLNIRGFFNPVKIMVNHMVANGFLRPDFRQALVLTDDIDEAVQAFRAYTPPPKW